MSISAPRTTVHPSGHFLAGIHAPSYSVINLRITDPEPEILGHEAGHPVTNARNFPPGAITAANADRVVEIPNPFPFWGTTYILDQQARGFASAPDSFSFNSFDREKRGSDPSGFLQKLLNGRIRDDDGDVVEVKDLPPALRLALAQNARDPELLARLADISCRLEYGEDGKPRGIAMRTWNDGTQRPEITDFNLFKTVSNNPCLPDSYKLAMVLRPGAQGTSPVVGEYGGPGQHTHVWEYLRTNSYIPYGHFASNMAHDSVRYSVMSVDSADMQGLRALYYQRIYINMAAALGLIEAAENQRHAPLAHNASQLEKLRQACLDAVGKALGQGVKLPYNAVLWGWNYGYDFSPSGYRLHASHQMVHQQFALIPPEVSCIDPEAGGGVTHIPSYAIGDQVADFVNQYRRAHGTNFFEAYIKAIKNNRRMDQRDDLPSSLVLWEDENVMLHAPKAQRSQGEVQVMAKTAVGNILEADTKTRASLDEAILRAVKTLGAMGAEMITCYEVSKRLDSEFSDQRLFYCFLPRHSRSPGAFSERQGRWITGHYPEDFARAFRHAMKGICT